MFSLGRVEKLRSGAVAALDLRTVQIEANKRNFLVVSSEYALVGRKTGLAVQAENLKRIARTRS